ncbi:MAG: Gp15 family bacteriophage protein [Lachnospiraceae bacterium]|nr:Gp15 family bacteriophage protein [Lachnospiraceae bacterium]
MLGKLPTTLSINEKDYAIRTDYRDILTIFSAFNDKDLSDSEKVFVCMKRLYKDFSTIPKTDYEEAYKAVIKFIECQQHDDKPSPKIVNWEKDEQLIFPAVNKVAGCEIRAIPYMHWWTFLGYFMGIDREDTWGFILTIRQKKAHHKKLADYEKEFYLANPELCNVERKEDRKTAEDKLSDIFDTLLQEGGAD